MSKVIDLLEERKRTEICREQSERKTCPCCGRWIKVINEVLDLLKQPKCKTCGDTKKIPANENGNSGHHPDKDVKAVVPCPDCQQPTAGEFTADMRHLIGFFGHLSNKYSLEVCARLDTSEARVKDLLEASGEARDDFYYIYQHPEDAHTDSYNFMEKVKQAKKKE